MIDDARALGVGAVRAVEEARRPCTRPCRRRGSGKTRTARAGRVQSRQRVSAVARVAIQRGRRRQGRRRREAARRDAPLDGDRRERPRASQPKTPRRASAAGASLARRGARPRGAGPCAQSMRTRRARVARVSRAIAAAGRRSGLIRREAARVVVERRGAPRGLVAEELGSRGRRGLRGAREGRVEVREGARAREHDVDAEGDTGVREAPIARSAWRGPSKPRTARVDLADAVVADVDPARSRGARSRRASGQADAARRQHGHEAERARARELAEVCACQRLAAAERDGEDAGRASRVEALVEALARRLVAVGARVEVAALAGRRAARGDRDVHLERRARWPCAPAQTIAAVEPEGARAVAIERDERGRRLERTQAPQRLDLRLSLCVSVAGFDAVTDYDSVFDAASDAPRRRGPRPRRPATNSVSIALPTLEQFAPWPRRTRSMWSPSDSSSLTGRTRPDTRG